VPAAVAIPAAVSLGSSVLGGVLGSRASKKAGQAQEEEALRQAQDYRNTLGQYNPQIGTIAETAATDVLGASDLAGQRVLDSAATGAGQVRTDALAANELLDPYVQLGAEGATSLREFMAPGGAGSKQFTAADMAQYDPGYKFRLDEAARAVQASAAARGGALGGGALKALVQRSQDVASSEFGAASDRFRQQQNDRYNRLFGSTQLGGQYAGQAGQNLIGAGQFGAQLGMQGAQYAGNAGMQGSQWAGNARMGATEQMAQNAFGTQRSIADMMTGGAASRAAGTVGSANAWGGALQGIGNAAQGVGRYYQDRETLKDFMNPANNPWIMSSQRKAYYPTRSTYMPNAPMPYTGPSYEDIFGGPQ